MYNNITPAKFPFLVSEVNCRLIKPAINLVHSSRTLVGAAVYLF